MDLRSLSLAAHEAGPVVEAASALLPPAEAEAAPPSSTPTPAPPPPLRAPSDIEHFINRLVDLTEQEREVEEGESRLLFSSCPFSLLEKRGLALGNLAIAKTSIGLGGKTLIDLERPAHLHSTSTFPPHSFRPGDLASIVDHSISGNGTKGKGKPAKESPAIEGVVWKVLETRIVVALNRGRGGDAKEEDTELPERIRLLKVANPSTFDRQVQTLRTLLRNLYPTPYHQIMNTPPPLVSLLLGLSSPLPFSPPTTPTTFYDPFLNPSQKSAVDFALAPTSLVSLIWGPPGTGKTQTLVEIVRHLVASGQRVLICGGSNLSVDNLLLRLSLPHPTFPPIPLTRLGHPARVLNSLVEHTLDSQSLRTDAADLLVGIKEELGGLETALNGVGKGRVKGRDRKDKWEEVRALRKEYRKRESGVVIEVLKRAKVCLATCHGAGSRILENERFDVVIIDEAAQAVEPSCWIPILKGGKKLILAGDHLQLPPTIKSLNGPRKATTKAEPKFKSDKSAAKGTKAPRGSAKTLTEQPPTSPAAEARASSPPPPSPQPDVEPAPPIAPPTLLDPTSSATSPSADFALSPLSTTRIRPSPTLELTLFSRLLDLHGPGIRRMLTTQYRFNEKIMRFPSEALYDGELIAADSVKDRVLSDLPGVEKDEDLDEPVVFIDTAGAAMFERKQSADESSLGSESKSNENEAALVIAYVDTLLAANVPAEAIAIVSPYNSQVSLLASLIHPNHPEVEIASIDSFQGREQEVVIISLVRSNEEGIVGFLSEQRRLNVAMTRPRRQLVVVGDSGTVAKGSPFLKKWMDWLEENADVRVAE
ncbi:hypothetical protein RQP46_002590 [Phenoliferia psychrophenolica]